MPLAALLIRLGLALVLASVLSHRLHADDIVSPVSPHEPEALAAAPANPDVPVLEREASLVNKAEEKLLAREKQIVDPMRDLLIREANLVAAASEKPLPKTPTIDRVTFAEKLVKQSDFRMAINLLRDITHNDAANDDERSRAQLLLGRIALQQGRSTDAVVELSAWLGNFPRRRESPYVYFLLGQAYRDLGVYEQARDNFYRVLSGSLMSVQSNEGDFDREKKLVRAAVWQLAETEYQHRNWERALTFFDRFTTQNPSGDQLVEAAMYRKADCKYQMRRTDDATVSYEKALAVAPFHPFAPEAWLRLYFLYGQSQRLEKQAEALHALTWIVKSLQPDRMAYWQQRGVNMLMELPQENRISFVTLRDNLRRRADEPGWQPIYQYLDALCSRLTLDQASVTPVSATSQSTDDFAKWKTDYTRARQDLQKRAKPLLDRPPIAAPAFVDKSATNTQG